MKISSTAIINRRQEARRQRGLPSLIRAAKGLGEFVAIMAEEGEDVSTATVRNWSLGRSKPQRRLWSTLYRVAEKFGIEILLEPSNESGLCGVPGCHRRRDGQFCASHRKRVATHGDPLGGVPIGELTEISRETSQERKTAMQKMRAEGKSYPEIASAFGVTKQRAWQICNPSPEVAAG